jgi:hypothetical protein
MPGKRITFALFVVLSLVVVGCGGGGDEPPSESEKADDVAILNTALGYELAAIDAYSRALPLLRGETLATAREFRAQEQGHVDAITKAIRGLSGRTDAEELELDLAPLKTRADALTLAYSYVSAAIAEEMSAVASLTATWPRALLTSIAANEAQQLAVLRLALGTDPVPEAFENGEIPLPGTG